MGCRKLTYYNETELEKVGLKKELTLKNSLNNARSFYLFGFNGQEKDDEIFNSTGSSYTAEFWQYDSRLGRRWNLDPVINPNLSQYTCFSDNPLYYMDPYGLKPHPHRTKKWWMFWRKGHIRRKAGSRTKRRTVVVNSPTYPQPTATGTMAYRTNPPFNYSISEGYKNFILKQQQLGAEITSFITFTGTMVGFPEADFINTSHFEFQINNGAFQTANAHKKIPFIFPNTGDLDIISSFVIIPPGSGGTTRAVNNIFFRFQITTKATTFRWKMVEVKSPKGKIIGHLDRSWLTGGRPPWYGGHIFKKHNENVRQNGGYY